MTCYLVRHGKDDDSVRGGWSSAPLTNDGIMQVKQLAQNFLSKDRLNVGRIYSSDLRRAMQTASILSEALSIPVTKKPEFREVNNGILAGMDNRIAAECYPGLYWSTLEWDQPYPSGESPCQFYNRISNAWRKLKIEFQDTNHDFILVTHGGVINIILCIENGIPFSNKKTPFPIRNAEMIAVRF